MEPISEPDRLKQLLDQEACNGMLLATLLNEQKETNAHLARIAASAEGNRILSKDLLIKLKAGVILATKVWLPYG